MAFRFANTGQSPFGVAQQVQDPHVQAQRGPDLEDIQTEEIGFLSLAGESKLRLLPTPWPSDSLPPPTSSLMSIASKKGVVAAAGPDTVIIATIESVRKAFEVPRSGDSEIRPFQPQLAIPMPMRISQVTFTANESVLVLSAESGGGLAVYEVQSLLNGSTAPAFQMSTNSLSLRALVPNPTPEKAELLAVVTMDGKLMMANLKEHNFVSGSSGQILKEGVTCVSWSVRGKQLVAGLEDGTACQMTPEGEKKADIPRPPTVDASCYVSSMIWLENNVFLMIHTPSNFDPNSAPPSTFHIVTRQQTSEFIFQNIPDPAEPFGLNRSPPHYFSLRLKDFPPSLQDLLIVASTASTDVGMFTRSKVALVADKPADKITGVFTMTGTSDDSRRAQMSMSEEMTDTSPIGLVLDLSSRVKVSKPIPKDEMEESPTPLPGIMVLNNEGILAYWWVIYAESIASGTIYPGLVAANGAQQPVQSTPTQQSGIFGGGNTAQAPTSAFLQPSFAAPPSSSSANSAFKPAAPAFGLSSAPGNNTTTAFGSASGLNNSPSVWGSSPSTGVISPGNTFGTSTFGSTSTPGAQGVAFGSSALPGNRASPWATGSTKPSGSAFGQPSGLGVPSSSSPFGSITGGGVFGGGGSGSATPASSGGFASFASTGGFAAAAAKGNNGSVFGSKPEGNAFSVPTSSPGLEAGTTFGGISVKEANKPHGLFGGKGFALSSTFKPDGSSKDDGLNPAISAGSSFFGSDFGNALRDAPKASSTATQPQIEADMDAEKPEPVVVPKKEEIQVAATSLFAKPKAVGSTTPVSTPATAKFQPPSSGLFGSSAPVQSIFPTTGTAKSAQFSFGARSALLTKEPEGAPFAKPILTSPTPTTPEPLKIKPEPSDDEVTSIIQNIPEAPLPPDPTSKSTYTLGESSVSSTEPDTIPAITSKTQEMITPSLPKQQSPLAEPQQLNDPPRGLAEEADNSEDYITDDEADDESESRSRSPSEADSGNEDGSGEDVTKDLSPTPGSHPIPGFTPGSSSGATPNRNASNGLLSKVSKPAADKPLRSLFGEIHNNRAPMLPPPKDLSPRSPSPVRTSIPGRLRTESSRSVSAPGVASQLLGPQRPTLSRPVPSSGGKFSLAASQRQEEKRQVAAANAREAEESQALIDEEDESVQRFLHQEIVGTKKLDDFIAHQDYVSSKDKDSIPSQVEAVYRDINSMIDTLGINSCSLKSFIKGHSEKKDSYVRTREDLDGEDEWLMVEIETLSHIIEEDLSTELERGCIKDLAGKLEACTALERDIGKLRAKHDDIKMLIVSQSDPDHLAVVRSKSLSAEQATQQHDLRRDFANFQKLLNEAEESLTMLRAQLAAHGGRSGRSTSGPTVEAVMKTIVKMTTMAEKRSGDIDVLENQIRKLRFSSAVSNGSREGSPFATTPMKASVRNSGTSSTFGTFYTPDSVKDNQHGLRNSISSSAYSFRGTPPRKKLSGFTAEDKLRIKANMARRHGVVQKLKAALQKSGTRVYGYDE